MLEGNEDVTSIELNEKEAQRPKGLPIDCDTSVIKSSRRYGKKDTKCRE